MNPKIKTEVRHSESKNAWNVVGVEPLGGKYKIARVPYQQDDRIGEITNKKYKDEAFDHAAFISWCFNNSSEILKLKNR